MEAALVTTLTYMDVSGHWRSSGWKRSDHRRSSGPLEEQRPPKEQRLEAGASSGRALEEERPPEKQRRPEEQRPPEEQRRPKE